MKVKLSWIDKLATKKNAKKVTFCSQSTCKKSKRRSTSTMRK